MCLRLLFEDGFEECSCLFSKLMVLGDIMVLLVATGGLLLVCFIMSLRSLRGSFNRKFVSVFGSINIGYAE